MSSSWQPPFPIPPEPILDCALPAPELTAGIEPEKLDRIHAHYVSEAKRCVKAELARRLIPDQLKNILIALHALAVDCRSLPPGNDQDFYTHAQQVRQLIDS